MEQIDSSTVQGQDSQKARVVTDRGSEQPHGEHLPRSGNFMTRHWRGEYSLARSYWINGMLVNVAGMAASWALQVAMKGVAIDPMMSCAMIILLYGLLLVVTVWQVVGIWRSASLHVARGGTAFWATAARILVAIGLMQTLASVVTEGIPVIRSTLTLALGQSPIPPYRLSLMRDDTELELAGGISFGTFAALQKSLDEHPDVRIIHLNSSGGLVKEAMSIADLIRSRELTTYTSGDCISACTLAFLAGQERLLGEKGRIGFHSPSLVGSNQPNFDLNAVFSQALKSRGASPVFIFKAMTTPPDKLWFPDNAELKREYIITDVVDSRNYATSLVAPSRDEQGLERYLQGAPVLQAIARHDPVRYTALKESLDMGGRQGLSPTELHRLADEKLREAIPDYLRKAPGPELVRYWETQIAEMAALEAINPQHCVDFAMDNSSARLADVQQLLPMSLLTADVDALTALIEAASLRPHSSINTPQAQQDLRLALGRLEGKQPGALEVIRDQTKYRDQPKVICESFSGMYREFLAVEGAERAGDVFRFLLSGTSPSNGK
ncbi:ATP-dependent Clp protease proteolytic subunit [Pseudomonas citronellolis]|uniref:ATP-dependent Clp protease proteolytic subunit n=1 Tax=Pseudomonas citronellolis TaxID=53408 RepID=UPI0023E46B18|nr:ATP-dependent Clp protease proteolytic subunit [Pseudomonas citronellolis]MDF3931350.1 ATP-dependent Clp protease proteolytic subunit [Pseudomonas citronellolis]